MNNGSLLLDYILRILPALALGILFLWLLPKRELGIRIFVYICLFILSRDAMTAPQLWGIGSSTFWIRFYYPHVLIILGVAGVGTIFIINTLEPSLNALIKWRMRSWLSTLNAGIIGAALIALPVFAYGYFVALDQRGGAVPTEHLAWFLIFSLLGNFFEEVLFRGYLQGYLETLTSPTKSALLSATAFSFGHIFLATTVTAVGWPILLFTFYEGLICAFIRQKHGVLAASLSHGLGIFVVASSFI